MINQTVVLFNENLGSFLALNADVEAVLGVGYAYALEVVVLDGGVLVNDDVVHTGFVYVVVVAVDDALGVLGSLAVVGVLADVLEGIAVRLVVGDGGAELVLIADAVSLVAVYIADFPDLLMFVKYTGAI